MGAVYLGHDTQLDRQVALKTPTLDDAGESGELVERFYREARAAATLRHPNICPVYDVGAIDGTHYITMAYIEGRPLSAYTRADKPIPARTAAIIVGKLAQALAAAHAEEVIHRDLKPANVMIDKNREPVVMDFGLARRSTGIEQSQMTQSGMILGTPAYMSPEQVEGKQHKVGPAADQYSLGVMLYEMLVGQLPFRGSVAAVIGQIMTQTPPAPRELCDGVDAELESICLKMMAKSSAERYASMSEVADALGQWLKSSGSLSSVQPNQAAETAGGAGASAAAVASSAGQQGQLQAFFSDLSGPGKPAVARAPRPVHHLRRLPPRAWWIAGTSVVGVLLALAVVFLLPTPNGTVRIEVNVPDLEVRIDDEEITLEDKKWQGARKARPQKLAVRIGDQLLNVGSPTVVKLSDRTVTHRLAIDVGGVALTSDTFEVVRDTTTVVKISYQQQVAMRLTDSSPTGAVQPPGADAVLPGSAISSARLELVRTFERLAGRYSRNYAFAMSHDGRWLIHSITPDGKLERHDLAQNKVVELPFDSPVHLTCAGFSEDGRQIVLGTQDSTVLVYDVDGKGQPVVLKTAQAMVRKVTFAGDYVVAWSHKDAHNIERWSRSDWKPAGAIKASINYPSYKIVAVAEDGEIVCTPSFYGSNSPRFWNLSTGEPLPVTFGVQRNEVKWSTVGVSISPDRERVLSWGGRDHRLVVWDARTGAKLLEPPIPADHPGLSCAIFSPDGRTIVCSRSRTRAATGDPAPGQLVLLSAQTGEMIAEAEIPLRPAAVERYSPTWAKLLAISGDGRTIATAGQATPICVWKLNEQRPRSQSGDDREVTKRILQLGGQLQVGGPETRIASLDDIPPQPFRVTYVMFSNGRFGQELAVLQELPELRMVMLNRPEITQAGYQQLAKLTQLEYLWLARTNVSDDDLHYIAQMQNLDNLDLRMTSVSDKGIQHLSSLKNLRTLSLPSKNVTQEGMQRLQAELPSCQISRK